MATGPRINVELRSTGVNKKGKPTGYAKTTTTNPKNAQQAGERRKLELMKFDPRAWNEETGRCGKRVLFKEKKIAK